MTSTRREQVASRAEAHYLSPVTSYQAIEQAYPRVPDGFFPEGQAPDHLPFSDIRSNQAQHLACSLGSHLHMQLAGQGEQSLQHHHRIICRFQLDDRYIQLSIASNSSTGTSPGFIHLVCPMKDGLCGAFARAAKRPEHLPRHACRPCSSREQLL